MEISGEKVTHSCGSRTAYIVNCPSIVNIDDRLLNCAQSKRQIVILEIEKHVLIKAADSVKQRAADHENTALDKVCTAVTSDESIGPRTLSPARLESAYVAEP